MDLTYFNTHRFSLRNIFIGICIGIWWYLSPLFLFVAVLTVAVIYTVQKSRYPDSEKSFLTTWIVIGIVSRIAISLIITVIYLLISPAEGSFTLFPDELGYRICSWYQSQIWLGNLEDFPHGWRPYSKRLFFYYSSLLTAVFGYSPIAINFMNCFLGTINAVILFDLMKRLSEDGAKKIVFFLMIFFPSLFLWSALNLKDTFIVSCLVLSVWTAILFNQSNRIIFLIISIIGALLATGTRYILCLSLLPAAWFVFMKMWKNASISIRVMIIFVGILSFIALQPHMPGVMDIYHKIKAHQYIMQVGAATRYNLFLDSRDTLLEFFVAVPLGFGYLLLTPLPWSNITTPKLFPFYPEAVISIFLTPFFILGVIFAFRKRFAEHLGINTLFMPLLFILCVSEGNIGISFRHKSMVLPFIFIYAAIGINHLFGRERQQKLNKELNPEYQQC